MKTEPLIELLMWEQARAQASPIRFTVFCEEQGVPREIELDEQDSQSIHAVAYEGTRAVGTARLLPDGHIRWRFRRKSMPFLSIAPTVSWNRAANISKPGSGIKRCAWSSENVVCP